MSASGADAPKYKLCPTCRHIYPATSNFCPQDQTALIVSNDIIAGRYILSQMVGAGAMGKVFMAEDTQLGRRVALKLLKPGQDAQRRSDLEAKAVGALDHDNVVRVYERGQHDDGRQYIAMEYLEGESLRIYLATQGRLPLVKAMELWVQAVRGVAAAHRKNVVHRDLKPDNLFLARRELDDGPIEQLKVLDFGIAQISDRPVRGTVRIGTPGYVAPEQWMHGKATARSDVYSLGIILLEMLTGLRALAANPQAPLETLERLAIAQTLSPALRQLLTEVLSEEPEARPADARLLLERLRGLSESQLLGAGAIVVARETPAVLNLATSGEPVRPLSRSSEELQPLGSDDDDADTEQVGIESLRPPAPVASPPAKGLGPATVRAPHLPGIVPTPTPARPTGIRPEKPPAKLPAKVPPLPRAPAAPIGQAQVTEVVPPPVMPPIALAGPDVPTDRPGKPPTTEVPGQDPAPITAPVPQAVSDLVTGQVTEQHPDLQNAPRSEPGTASRSDPAGSLRSAALSDLMTDPLPEKWNLTLPENELTNRLPLLAQSTLVMGTPAEMRTLNLPALGSVEGSGGIGSTPALPPRNSMVAGSPGAAGGGGAPVGSSSAAGGLAATVLSGRTHASTLGPSAAQTLPLGQMSQLNPMNQLNALSSSSSLHPLAESRSQKLQDFLNTPTVLGSRARLMMVCAVLGLLVVAVIGLLRR